MCTLKHTGCTEENQQNKQNKNTLVPKKIIRNRINGLEKEKKKRKTRNISKVKIVTELYSVQER